MTLFGKIKYLTWLDLCKYFKWQFRKYHVKVHICSQYASVSTPKKIPSKNIMTTSARYTFLHSLKSFMFQSSPPHKLHSDLDFCPKLGGLVGYVAGELGARRIVSLCERPVFDWATIQTFHGQLKCAMLPPAHSCSQHDCVSTHKKIP